MRKMTKLLSAFLAVLMLFSLLPLTAFAEDETYKLTVKNSAAAGTPAAKFAVTINGQAQPDCILKGQEIKQYDIKAGDTYSVQAVGAESPYYTMKSVSGTFTGGNGDVTKELSNVWPSKAVCDEEESVTGNPMTEHKLGQGFVIPGETVHNYYVNKADGSTQEIPGTAVATGKNSEKQDFLYWTESVNTWHAEVKTIKETIHHEAIKIGKMVITPAWDEERLTGFNINFTGTAGAAQSKGVLTKQVGADVNTLIHAESHIDDVRNMAKAQMAQTFSGYANTDTVLQDTIGFDFDIKNFNLDIRGDYSLCLPVTDVPIPKREECAASDVTVSFTPEIAEKTGPVSFNTLNENRLQLVNDNINYTILGEFLDFKNAEETKKNWDLALEVFNVLRDDQKPITLDLINDAITNPLVNSIVAVSLCDELPAPTITLQEVETEANKAFFENRTYEIKAEETKSLPCTVSLLGQSADIPLSIGWTYDFGDVRIGTYQVTISDVGGGWAPKSGDIPATGTITVNEKGIVPLDEFLGITVKPGIGESDLKYGQLTLLGTLHALTLDGIRYEQTKAVNTVEFSTVTYDNETKQTEKLNGASFALMERDAFAALIGKIKELGGSALEIVEKELGVGSADEIMALAEEPAEGEEKPDIKTQLTTMLAASLIQDGKLTVTVPAYLEAMSGVPVQAVNEEGTLLFNEDGTPQMVYSEDGIVRFTPESNRTLDMLIQMVKTAEALVNKYGPEFGITLPETLALGDRFGEVPLRGKDGELGLLDLLDKLQGDGRNVGSFALKFIGVIGDTMPVGDYILFETDVPEGSNLVKSPLTYTINDYFDTEKGSYAAVGKLNTDLSFIDSETPDLDPLDPDEFLKFLQKIEEGSEEEQPALEKLINDLIRGTDSAINLIGSAMQESEVAAALVAYVADKASTFLFDTLGGEVFFASPEAIADMIMQMLGADKIDRTQPNVWETLFNDGDITKLLEKDLEKAKGEENNEEPGEEPNEENKELLTQPDEKDEQILNAEPGEDEKTAEPGEEPKVNTFSVQEVLDKYNALMASFDPDKVFEVNTDWEFINFKGELFTNAYDLFYYVLSSIFPDYVAEPLEDGTEDGVGKITEAANGLIGTITGILKETFSAGNVDQKIHDVADTTNAGKGIFESISKAIDSIKKLFDDEPEADVNEQSELIDNVSGVVTEVYDQGVKLIGGIVKLFGKSEDKQPTETDSVVDNNVEPTDEVIPEVSDVEPKAEEPITE